MHFLTLVTVEVPETIENEIQNQEIKIEIEKLKMAIAEAQKISTFGHVLLKCNLKRLQGLQNTFGRTVDEKVSEFLDPFGAETDNPKYIEFYDTTDDLKYEYENETVDFIKFPNGTYLSTRSEEYYDKYLVKDGKVYERSWGQLKQPKSTKRTKRMKVIKDEPLNKHYKTFENFLKAECQDSFCEKENSYGYYCNSCAYYDWFLIGGRWPKCFLVKDTCTEYSIGDRSTDKDELVAPKGYKWVVAARKKDIEWEVIRNWHIEKSTNEYHECVRLYGLEEIPKESDYRKNEKGLTWWGEQIYLAGDTLEDFLKRHCVSDKIKYDFSPFAYYEGEEYFDKYCLPRSEDKGDYDNAWQNVIDKFIDGLSDNTVLVGVDCHM